MAHRVEQPFHMAGHQVDQQMLFRGEVVVNGALADADRPRDISHGNTFVTMFCEEPPRVIAQVVFGVGSGGLLKRHTRSKNECSPETSGQMPVTKGRRWMAAGSPCDCRDTVRVEEMAS